MTFHDVLAVVFGFLALGGNALAQETRTHTATGSAVMGTGMTIKETKRLALDAARRQALQKFGAHVRSEETVGSGGISQETQVSNAAVVSVENKKVNRTVRGEAIRFTVTADFEIDVSSFESGSQEADRGFRIESSGDEVYRTSLEEHESVSGSSGRIRGDAEMNAQKRRAEQKRAFRRHVAFIRQNARPSQVTDVKLMGKPEIRSTGKLRQVKETFRVEPGFRDLVDTLRSLRSGWGGLEAPIDMQRTFSVVFVGTSVGGKVTFVKPATRLFQLDYTKGVLFRGPETYDFNIRISPSTLRKTRRVNLLITRFTSNGDLRTYLRKNGFKPTLSTYEGGSLQRNKLVH